MVETAKPPHPATRSLRTRFTLNALSYGYMQAVTIVSQLILVPFFLTNWGVERYAEWLVLTGIPQMLILLDLGVTQASANRATLSMGKGDIAAARSALQTSFVFTIITCVSIFVIVAVVSNIFNLAEFLKITTITKQDAIIILILVTGCLCLNFVAGYLGAWFRTIDRTALGTIFLANRRVIDIAIVAATLSMGGSAKNVAYAMLLGQVLITLAMFLVAYKLSPKELFGISNASIIELHSIWKPALGSLSIPIAQTITLQGGIQFLNHIATPSLIVIYTMTRTLMRLIIQVGITSNNALVPEISRLEGEEKGSETKQFVKEISLVVLTLCTTIYLALSYFGPSIIQYWSAGKVSVERITLLIVGIHAVLNVGWYVPASYTISKNQHMVIGIGYAISSLITIMLWWLLIDHINPLTGASMLLAIPEVCVIGIMIARHKELPIVKSNVKRNIYKGQKDVLETTKSSTAG